ncbi:DUF1538 domain-containing protein [Scatolibacter rhodanostii]|uniref:DUF1538 domain-containing protein n=1 Tax=Scatolibacter rhodanostii TaxID=2014781 RepID=UPI000C08AC5B|nr:DUF1538 domain-containing protein [Scatolibacter rhodanostii]
MKTTRVLKETFLSTIPLAVVIIIVCGFVAPMESTLDYFKLIIGYVSVVIGQTLFLVGLDASILPIGKLVGKSLIKLKKAVFIIFFGFLFGFLATAAEPALAVLARQAKMVMPIIHHTLFIWILSAGIGVFVGFALFRIMKDISIKIVFAALYIILFATIIFVPTEFVALAFDGSGATTGDVSVPFILALGMGVSATMSKHKTNDDTFGIIGMASVGPILAVFFYGIILKALNGGHLPAASVYDPGTTQGFAAILISNLGEVALALIPVLIVFLPFQFFFIKLPKKEFIKILLGAITVYAGLLIFLSGIDFGFAFAGKYIGEVFLDPTRSAWFKWLLLIVGFVLGVAITLSEPGVTVLGDQLEEITNGHIKKMTIRLTLALGIGVASLLSIVKILTQINILWFLVPLYAIALIMMKFTSPLFVGLAFDSGGVSGGALTSAFLTPLTLGVAQGVAATAGGAAQSILTNGFGIIAFISVTPLIAVQALGIVYDFGQKKHQKLVDEDEFVGLQPLLPQPANFSTNLVEENAAFDTCAECNGVDFWVIIASRKQKDTLLCSLLEMGAHLTNTIYGRGTVEASYLQNVLGLVPDEHKMMVMCILPDSKTDEITKMLSKKFHFDQPNTGIAFTIPIDQLSM